MDYKQKYESALEYMRKVYPTLKEADKEDVEHYFPELKESEDERIMKEIIELVKYYYGSSLTRKHTVSKDDMIAWLEKQGEQKPAEWSKEDEKLLKLSLENLTELKHRFGETYGKVGDCICWIQSLKERIK